MAARETASTAKEKAALTGSISGLHECPCSVLISICVQRHSATDLVHDPGICTATEAHSVCRCWILLCPAGITCSTHLRNEQLQHKLMPGSCKWIANYLEDV